MRAFSLVFSLFLALAAPGGCDFPRDSAGTLERIRSVGELRVGVVDNPPWVRVREGRAEGIEATLVRKWAERHKAKLRFVPGDLDGHVRALERNEIDVMIAGLTTRTPYKARLGLTQPYLEDRSLIASLDAGASRYGSGSRVLAAAPGESALLFDLDRFLLGLGEARVVEVARQTSPDVSR